MFEELGADHTEGDVETKIIQPFLTEPEFLGIGLEHIRSKKFFRPIDIGKGTTAKKGYYPDFGVYINGLPVCIVEAKSPSIDVETGYAEAALYALELNKHFAKGVNPCALLIATNGIDLLVGSWDAAPSIACKVSEVEIGSSLLHDLRALGGFGSLMQFAEKTSNAIRLEGFKRPFNQGEGPVLINSKIGHNSFAADLSPVLRRYFTSQGQQETPEIWEKAYISSKEITTYDRALESYLKERISVAKRSGKKVLAPTKTRETSLEAAIRRHDGERPIEGSLQLITGSVGAGKSLFARRYKEFLQPPEVSDRCHWAFINFNNAPPKLDGAEEWTCREFVSSLLVEGAPIDLSDAEMQEKVFAPNINSRRAYYERVEKVEAGRGLLELARDIEAWRQDPEVLAEAVARYLHGDRNENIVVVFDNVDRKDAEEQLQCFRLALWFMAKTRALVILAMRDVTFELYKNEPPLDTYKSGSVFHISPPRFVDVVRKRLELSLDALEAEVPETITYSVPSGARVSYEGKKAAEYLRTVYREVFERPRNISKIIEALAARNVRQSLDMFLSIINSGHMSEDQLSRISFGVQEASLSEFSLIRILMRGEYRFHSDSSGFMGNIFHCESNWTRPSNLICIEILFWLIGKRKVPGDNGHMGYFSLQTLAREMEILGFVPEDVMKAANYLVVKGLAEPDSLSQARIDYSDCIKVTASGFIHLRILSERIEYLSSVLPTTPLNWERMRSQVFDAMSVENRTGSLTLRRRLELTRSLQVYLARQKDELRKHDGYAALKRSGADYVLGHIKSCIDGFEKQRASGLQQDFLDLI